MNKRIIGVLMLGLLFIGCEYQKGNSNDTVYGYDKGLLWNHLYLTNDHTTCYCFDDQKVISILDSAIATGRKVEVNYGKYLLRGQLCSAPDKYETVVVDSLTLLLK